MIRTLPVDADRLNLVAAGGVTAIPEWMEMPDGSRRPSGEQKRDEDTGFPLWAVDCLAVAEGERPEVIGVQVPALDEPAVQALLPVSFEGLTVRVSKARDGSLRSYWNADAVMPAGARNGKIPTPAPASASA